MAQSRCKVTKPSVGIDLGTTYSCVAVFQNGRPEVIANSQGNRITPSVVAFTKDGRLVGEGAEIQRKLDPPNAIYNAKRFIGRMASDPAVRASQAAYPFKVMEINNKIQFAVSKSSGTVNLTPEEIAAAILSKMKKIVEDYLEETVEDVVITVPAYFTDSQRQATINAGQIAGLKVTRIINEPTAAAMAYGLREGTKDSEGKHILVYDLGGGTFDVSVLEIEEDLIQVKATAGDSNLGGEDFNDILVNHFKQEVLRRFKFDLTSNYKAIRRLTGACEKLKRNLSAENVKESKIELDNFLPEGRNFVSTLTRAKFENLCKDRFDETIKCVEKALLDANLIKEEIDEVVLVGGSSRIPKLQSMLSSFFNNKNLNKSINPDEAVACGAAVQAAIINNDPHLTVKDLLLMDVIPLSIGVNTGVTFDGITTIVVERNTAIPVRKTKNLCTVINNQTACSFNITEGERTMTRDNRILGSFEIYGLPPKKAGEVLFDTEFDIDENGILTVSATVRGMNKKAGITLDPRSTGNLSDEEVTRLVFEAKKMKVRDQNEENRTLAMNKLLSLCNHIIFVVQDLSQTDTGNVDTFGDVLNNAENCLSWIRQHPDAPEGEFISRHNSLSAETEHVFNLSTMLETSSQSSHVLRMSQQTAKSYLKEGRNLLQSSSINDIIKAAEYFYKAYKTASEGGKLLKQIEALVCFGHTHTILFEAISEEKVKLNHAFKAIKAFSLVMAVEENKTLSKEERNSVIQDLRCVVKKAFKIIDNLIDNKKYNVLDSFMSVLDKKNAAINPEFCQILFQCRIKEIKMVLKRIETCIVNENNKEVQNLIQTINYPKEQAKLISKTQEEKNQLHDVIELIENNVMHAEGLNQINLAVNLLEGANVDHPDTIDKALMALDHLIEAKHLTENTHDQIFIKANFFEGKVFMDYFPNTLKAKSCFENVVNASEQKNFNTEEYRKAKDILDEILKEQLQEKEKIPTANREKILRELQQEIQKIKQADNSLGDQNFIDFLFTEYPPKHKENSKKPSIAANGSKKKAYLRLSMFYHPDKVDASEYGEKYKALCGEISKHINGRL